MKTNLFNLFFWSWNTNFFSAIAPRQIYEDKWLFQKWKQKLFLQKMEAEIFPSYHFWSDLQHFLIIFPTYTKGLDQDYEAKFLKAPETFLKEALVNCLCCWRYFPQIFRDLYKFYPKYELSFSEVEFVYLDYWSQLPKVFASLLSELLVRDAPFREALPAKRGYQFFYQESTLPPLLFVDTSSNEALHAHVIDFLSGDEPENYFFKVINLYLKARPSIFAECSEVLLAKGVDISDKSLAEYFLGYYIFKDVSLDALKFIVANSNLLKKNPFKLDRDYWIKEWDSFDEERRQKVITRNFNSLEEIRRKVEKRASQTHEEKVAEKEANLRELADPNYLKNFKVAMIPLSELFPEGKKS